MKRAEASRDRCRQREDVREQRESTVEPRTPVVLTLAQLFLLAYFSCEPKSSSKVGFEQEQGAIQATGSLTVKQEQII